MEHDNLERLVLKRFNVENVQLDLFTRVNLHNVGPHCDSVAQYLFSVEFGLCRCIACGGPPFDFLAVKCDDKQALGWIMFHADSKHAERRGDE